MDDLTKDAERRLKLAKESWAKRVAKEMLGAQVIAISYVSEEECTELDWYGAPVILHMMGKDGTAFEVFPMRDDEGNDGGALGTTLEAVPTIPVI